MNSPRSCRVASLLALALTIAACGASGDAAATPAATLRLGYFPNLTHASALVGVAKGFFADALASQTKLETSTFNAGPAAVEALFSDAVDAAYLGPNPAINAYVKSHGDAIRIISGATSGGASLVVRPSINKASDLRGKNIASPQLGGTQDVALRWWLSQNGLHTEPRGGGDVAIVPQDNAQTLQTFKTGDIDGAWVPEPWAARLVIEGGGKILVDERDLWPSGRFVTTNLVVRAAFLRQHPDTVRRLLQGQVKANDFVNQHPEEAQQVVNSAIQEITGKTLKPAVVSAAWQRLTFTNDPLASTLRAQADHAQAVGLLGKADVGGIDDLGLLNAVLKLNGEAEVPIR